MTNKTKGWKERFIEAYKDNGWFIPSEDQKTILDFIKSELDNRDEEWLEAVGFESYTEPFGKDKRFRKLVKEIDIRNQLREEIKLKIKNQK